jgi:hypothetical protein
MTKDILRVKNGNVELMNISGQRIRTYYNKGDAERVDWYEEVKKSVQVQLKRGTVLIINSNCQVVKTIN